MLTVSAENRHEVAVNDNGEPSRMPLDRAILVWTVGSIFGWCLMLAVGLGLAIGAKDIYVALFDEAADPLKQFAGPGQDPAPTAAEMEMLEAIAPAAGYDPR